MNLSHLSISIIISVVFTSCNGVKEIPKVEKVHSNEVIVKDDFFSLTCKEKFYLYKDVYFDLSDNTPCGNNYTKVLTLGHIVPCAIELANSGDEVAIIYCLNMVSGLYNSKYGSRFLITCFKGLLRELKGERVFKYLLNMPLNYDCKHGNNYDVSAICDAGIILNGMLEMIKTVDNQPIPDFLNKCYSKSNVFEDSNGCFNSYYKIMKQELFDAYYINKTIDFK